jgi:hypothetical protein
MLSVGRLSVGRLSVGRLSVGRLSVGRLSFVMLSVVMLILILGFKQFRLSHCVHRGNVSASWLGGPRFDFTPPPAFIYVSIYIQAYIYFHSGVKSFCQDDILSNADNTQFTPLLKSQNKTKNHNGRFE